MICGAEGEERAEAATLAAHAGAGAGKRWKGEEEEEGRREGEEYNCFYPNSPLRAPSHLPNRRAPRQHRQAQAGRRQVRGVALARQAENFCWGQPTAGTELEGRKGDLPRSCLLSPRILQLSLVLEVNECFASWLEHHKQQR
eukprot:753424-Hanusia_phi.AAC.3